MSVLPQSQGRSRWSYWVPRLATSIFVPALLLLLLEGGLRMFDVGYPTNATRPCTVNGQAASCDNWFFAAPFFPRGMIRTPRSYAIPAVKSEGTFRIFIIGESAAYGDPDPAYGFSRYLEVMLRARFPQANFEVINTGITAVNSHVLVPLVRDLAKQEPDLFIIYAGNNEVVGPYGPGTVLASSAMNLPIIRANIFVRSTRVGQLITRIVQPKHQPQDFRGMEMFLEKRIRADSPAMAHVYENFEANMRDIITAARSSGAKVLVSTVAVNLKDCAPFASLHREGISQHELNSWNRLVDQAAGLESSGENTQALALYRSAAAIDGQYAELHYRMARCLLAMGDRRTAHEEFQRALDLDTLHFRADSRINGIIQSVAHQPTGVDFMDAAALFDGASSDGISGSELLFEHVHMTPRGNYLLALEIYKHVLQALPSQISRGAGLAEAPSKEECDRLLALTEYDRARVANDILQRVLRPPFTNQINHDEQIANLTPQAERPPVGFDDIARQYEWAISQNPQDRMLRLKFASFLFSYGQLTAGIEQLRLARPYDDFPLIGPDGRPL